MSSGTQHFKCPNCNNVHDIIKDFKKCGVYFAYKDAEWELPAQSSFYNFQDMYIQTKRCNVKNCISKEIEGRNFNGVESEFEIVLCDMCGTNGVHIKCADINEETLDYICVDCGGDVELEPRPLDSSTSPSNSFASLESSLNLSLASSGNESLSCDKEETPSESIQSIRDLLKQFETEKSEGEGMATLKITSSLDKPIDDSNANITLDSLLDTSEESEPSPTITYISVVRKTKFKLL